MSSKQEKQQQRAFIASIRQAAPYIQAHRGSTFVIAFGGEAVNEHFDMLLDKVKKPELARLNLTG